MNFTSRPKIVFTCGWMIATAVTHTAGAFGEGVLGPVLCQCNIMATSLRTAAYTVWHIAWVTFHIEWCVAIVSSGWWQSQKNPSIRYSHGIAPGTVSRESRIRSPFSTFLQLPLQSSPFSGK